MPLLYHPPGRQDAIPLFPGMGMMFPWIGLGFYYLHLFYGNGALVKTTATPLPDHCNLGLSHYQWPHQENYAQFFELPQWLTAIPCCRSEDNLPISTRENVPVAIRELMLKLENHFADSWVSPNELNIRCQVWLNATDVYISRGGAIDIKDLGPRILAVSAVRVLQDCNRLVNIITDWSCNNTYDADFALLHLLSAWHGLAEWQWSSGSGISPHSKELYMLDIRLIGLAATRVVARNMLDAHDSTTLGVWPLTPEQVDLDSHWRKQYIYFKRVATNIGWWARSVQNRQHKSAVVVARAKDWHR